jgi:hypothetical protein
MRDQVWYILRLLRTELISVVLGIKDLRLADDRDGFGFPPGIFTNFETLLLLRYCV